MFDEFLLLSTALVGMAFLQATRRAEGRPPAYTWVLAGVLALTLVAVAEDSRFMGVVAIGLAVLVVVVPWVLEWSARAFFSRGWLRLAVWTAGLRSMLMLGAGLGRQQQILHGLAVLERDGVDAAIGYFRGLAQDTEDGGELTLINEQIVSMLLYGQRWTEGISHYESRFPPRYAALRPALVLGLLRAYGEVGRLDEAASLLQALEEGPVGSDPRALGLVSQARLTFLVFAGQAAAVADALGDRSRRQLGLSAASGALFRGLAARQAGDAPAARTELSRVEDLATSRDDRVVESARRAIGELGAPPAMLDPVSVATELEPYVDSVAARLDAFSRMAPAIQRAGALLATPALMVVMGLGYFAMRWADHGGLGLLEAGAATPTMIRSGQLWRLGTAGWVHGDPLGLLLNIYTIWFTAPVVERMAGTGRTFVVAMLGAAAGVFVSGWLGPEAGMVLGGGGGACCALIGAVVLLLSRSGEDGVRQLTRRRLWVPLAMVTVAQGVASVPGFLAVETSWHGLAAAAVVGAVLALMPLRGRLRWLDAGLAAGLAVLSIVASVGVRGDDALHEVQSMPWRTQTLGGVALELPPTFERVEERSEVPGLPLPLHVGMLDGLALRAGDMVQLLVVAPEHEGDPNVPGLLRIDPSLAAELTLVATELPEVFVAAGLGPAVHAHWVRRNGAQLGLAVTRPLGSAPDDPAVVLFADPDALERQGAVYARALAAARVSTE